MKNWKKLISGVVAMMAVATAVSASPAKVPVEVLDVADATGVAVERATVTNNTLQTAEDEEGSWVFTTGSKGETIGTMHTMDNANGIAIRYSTSGATKELSAGYITNSSYTYADTKVQFTYKCNTIDEFKNHLIQVSSDSASQVTLPAEITGLRGLNYVKVNNDAAILVVTNGQLKYLDPADNALKETGVTIKEDTNYSFRFERTAGESTYDLYVDTVKIGANSTPVLEDVPLVSPTGKNFKQIRTWLGSAIGAEALNYTVYLSDISFMQSLSDKLMMEDFVNETFDTLPADVDNGGNWSYWRAEQTGKANHGSVAANGNLALVYYSDKNTTRNVNAWYENTDLAGLDEYEVSFEFTPNYDSSAVAEWIALAGGAAVTVSGAPTGVSGYNNSVQIAIADGKLYYGCTDESGNSFKEIPGISYANETKYYAKVAVNNVEKTYSLYLSTSPILLGAEPIIKNSGFFCPSDTVAAPYKLGFVIKKTAALAVVGNMTVDNLVFSKESEANIIKKETFDTLPEDDGWYHRQDPEAKLGGVSANGSLNIAYATKYARGGSMYSQYESAELASEDCFEFSNDLIFNLTPGKLWANFVLAGNGSNAEAVVTGGPTNTDTAIPAYYDSISIAVINDKFAYGCTDETGNYYKTISEDIVAFESGKQYYLKIKVDSTAGTYTMWLSGEKITSATTPVAENESFFLPSGTAPSKWLVRYTAQRLASSKDAGSIVVDNFTFKRSVKSSTAFAVMNDDQQYMTSLGTSAYIDLINVPTDKEVIVAYYDAEGKLVDIAIATADSLRAKKTDETAVSALVMTWDDFDNIVPVNAAIELK